MWPSTELTDLLQIKHPIIQAPMAGSTNPELVGAVSNAENNDNDFSFLLYGQAAALNCELPAFELLEKLAKEAQELLSC